MIPDDRSFNVLVLLLVELVDDRHLVLLHLLEAVDELVALLVTHEVLLVQRVVHRLKRSVVRRCKRHKRSGGLSVTLIGGLRQWHEKMRQFQEV